MQEKAVKKPVLQRYDWGTLLVIVTTLLVGGRLRLSFVQSSALPLNDGGMFYVMINELIHNQFRLPAFTSYNFSNIPYAYPPLGFYIVGLLNRISALPVLQIIRFYPAIINTVTIIAFYPLARVMLKSRMQAAIALILFGLFTHTFNWQIMGGGVTRATGMFFAVMALTAIYQMLSTRRGVYVPLAGALVGLTALSHLEMTLFTVTTAGLMFVAFGRSKISVMHVLVSAGIALAISSPWWLAVISQHSLAPFLNVLSSSQRENLLPSFAQLFIVLNLGDQPLWGALALLGIIYYAYRHQFFYLFWLVAIVFVYPRAAANFAPIPLAMLIATFVEAILLPFLQGKFAPIRPLPKRYEYYITAIFLTWLIAFMVLAAPATVFLPHLDDNQIEAMNWVASNTPRESKFAVLVSKVWNVDSEGEWFPAIAKRMNVLAVQGSEWLPDNRFSSLEYYHSIIEGCSDSVACLGEIPDERIQQFSYVVLASADKNLTNLWMSSFSSANYVKVYANPSMTIFLRANDR